MAYTVHNVQPGDQIPSRITREQDAQIAANEQNITQLQNDLASMISYSNGELIITTRS